MSRRDEAIKVLNEGPSLVEITDVLTDANKITNRERVLRLLEGSEHQHHYHWNADQEKDEQELDYPWVDETKLRLPCSPAHVDGITFERGWEHDRWWFTTFVKAGGHTYSQDPLMLAMNQHNADASAYEQEMGIESARHSTMGQDRSGQLLVWSVSRPLEEQPKYHAE